MSKNKRLSEFTDPVERENVRQRRQSNGRRYRGKDIESYNARKRYHKAAERALNPEAVRAKARERYPKYRVQRLAYLAAWRKKTFSYEETVLDALRAVLSDRDHDDNPFNPKKYAVAPITPEQKAKYTATAIARNRHRYQADLEFRNALLKRRKELRKRQDPAKRRAYWSAWHARRMATDPLYKIGYRLRRRLQDFLKLRRWKRTSHTKDLVGADYLVVRNWIERQFLDEMTWKNYGTWHIDHRIPLASAKTVTDLEKLFHYTNLQPLWALDNRKKGARL